MQILRPVLYAVSRAGKSRDRDAVHETPRRVSRLYSSRPIHGLPASSRARISNCTTHRATSAKCTWPPRAHLVFNGQLIPTGERKPVETSDPHALEHGQLDDVFSDLVRDGDGRARFWVEGLRQRVTVAYGPRYPVAVVYAPQGQEFICFEPMAAVTNAFNLAQAGLYQDLQTIPPGGGWRESFWIEVQA
jgi:galactose mutarotase-like enzyme